MDLRQLEMFVAVAENSSFTVAGLHLHVAQSAISRKVKLLEEELGEDLFKRVNRKVYLTPAGDIMLRYARRIFQELRNATLEISELTQMNRGTIRIGAGMTATMYLLPPILERFRQKYPGIDLQVLTGSSEHVVNLIRSNQLDVGVITLPVHDTDLEVIPFATEEMVVVTSINNEPLRKRRVISAVEMCAYPMILFSRGTATRELLEDYFRRLGLSPRVSMDSESVATIKPLVQVNLGISILPAAAVAAEVKRGELHAIHLRDDNLSRSIGLVTHRVDHHPRALAEIIAMLRSPG